MKHENRTWYLKGIKDGIPICLGYFAVSLTLGIPAKKAGLSAITAAIASFTNHASAGEFIAFTLMAAGASYIELFIMEAVANARYLLMSCALSQKLSSDTSILHRMVMGFFITDEIFGASISVPGKLNPYFVYGLISIASPGWVAGTYLGVILGNILPARAVSALSVGLFGMFIAIFIPPAKKNKIILGLIAISFASSYIFSKAAIFASISQGIKIIILTVIISLAAALLFPIKDEFSENNKTKKDDKLKGCKIENA